VTAPVTSPSAPGPPDQTNPHTNIILTIAAALLTVVVLSTLAGVVITKRHIVFRHKHIPEQLVLTAANAPGDDPFFVSSAVSSPTVSAGAAEKIASTTEQLPASQERGVRLVSGAHPGLYGAIGQQNPCNTAGIANALDSQSDLALAWAQAQNIQPNQIPYYMNTLTGVVLTADTWVTSHHFSSGRSIGFQTVLQAGSAVMIDPAGVPRLRCISGNPLRPPARENIAGMDQTGTSWPGYSPQNVVAIAYTNAPSSFTDPVPVSPATEFNLLDLGSGNLQSSKAGGTIDLSAAGAPSWSLPDPIAANTPPEQH